VHGFVFLATVAIPKYLDAAHSLAILMLALFFVPQTTVIRNFWMLDRKLWRLFCSNVIGAAATAGALGALAYANGLTLDAVAWAVVIGNAVYWLFIMGTAGRELWGIKTTVEVASCALVGFGVSLLVTLGFGVPDTQVGTVDGIARAAGHLALGALVLAPVVVYGLRRTNLLAALRSAPPDDQVRGGSDQCTTSM
jgi:hypothetical protein